MTFRRAVALMALFCAAGAGFELSRGHAPWALDWAFVAIACVLIAAGYR